ncbi:TPM domain-containing protein [Ancylobacter sp. Lp-2]|uniref:TPM domain-containing protein n=1 Tax=Ancylobacter sp. Lp-2 TaxID=2881339 RepID=UPI001E32A4A7|nr:TPM domain-containing protein [Ancylobacter sp. Lp-2]MCB4767799.1 TPM domain-containing protein [Ancylobacter sp. Lp-2]
MLRRAAFLIVLALTLATAVAARAELTFPPLSGRVVDAAGILSPQVRAALEAKLAAQEAKTTDQFVVATVPSLQGTSVEDYANRLFRAWKLGQTDKDNGALLMVAPAERRVRIEVGYGLEGVLPDAVASTIIQTAILPEFRAGNFPAGIEKGTDAVIEILNLDPAEAEARARKAAEPAMTPDDWVPLIIFAVMIGFWIFVVYRQVRGGYLGRRGAGGAALPGGISGWEWSRGRSRGGWSGGGGGWSSGRGGGGFSGGGGSSGGGGASGSW